jgi:hypothetical protein
MSDADKRPPGGGRVGLMEAQSFRAETVAPVSAKLIPGLTRGQRRQFRITCLERGDVIAIKALAKAIHLVREMPLQTFRHGPMPMLCFRP